MKRIIKLVAGDVRFQIKYGFYLLYAFFTFLYIAILHILPSAWKSDATTLVIYSDPALLGLIFVGVIVLFEKSERVIDSIAVSPVKTGEYLFSKAITLGLISLLSGVILGITSDCMKSPIRFVGGLFFGSCVFTWIGLLISTRIKSLNQYVMYLIPLLIIVVSPVIVYRFFSQHSAWLLHPGVATFELLNNSTEDDLIAGISITVWLIISYVLTRKQFSEMLKTLGGVKL